MTGDADAIVVGSGPNGLAAAVTLAAAGVRVLVLEGAASVGGGCRTAELTSPGYRHDVCSSAHPLAAISPFFRRFDLAARGVRMAVPEVAFAHPLDGREAPAVTASAQATAAGLGPDEDRYLRLISTLADSDALPQAVMSSMRALPRPTPALVSFAGHGLRSAEFLARRMRTEPARALLAGAAAHAMAPLTAPLTAGMGLFLIALAHRAGWPVAIGGSQRITDAMTDAILAAGARIDTGVRVTSLRDLPPARAVLLDVAPAGFARIAGPDLPGRYRAALLRFRHGPGVCKVDFALGGPVPWIHRAAKIAGTLHVGGTFAEVAAAESDVAAGRHPAAPFVIAVQPGVVDASRAPAGRQVLWAYCHVPAGSDVDMAPRIEAQIERFAPGFRDLVLAKHTMTAADLARYNPNYVGGDIGSGAIAVRQIIARPTARLNPYRTPLRGVYLCSASTPPGPGVHGRCGELAALTALRERFGVRTPPPICPDALPGLPAGPAAG